jgi:exopolysaccharide production negative regulator
MRISSRPVIRTWIFGLTGAIAFVGLPVLSLPAHAFSEQVALAENMSPEDAFRIGAQAYRAGDANEAVPALEFAARLGHPLALWRLGKMYAAGDGVERDDLKAFQYFQQLADNYADDNPRRPAARIVADAFMAIANYYTTGIPNTAVGRNIGYAADLVRHAATYFGDTSAQYQMAMMYIRGEGVEQSGTRAVRWLMLAAKEHHVGSQGELGRILWLGEDVPRRPIEGLMWLQIASQNPLNRENQWISGFYDEAFAAATDSQRSAAVEKAERWRARNIPE